MATYSKKDFDTKTYDSARPSYPDEFYPTILDYHQGPRKLAVDIGCGSGFVTFKLTPHFDRVIGTDISETMIAQCKSDPRAVNGPEFFVAPGEDLAQIESGSVDLLTGAECCHWLNHPRWFKECHRVLRQGGTLAYWFYLDPVFVSLPIANEIYQDYAYGLKIENGVDRFMGNYYEQPGHEFFRTAMKTVEIPSDLFEDILVNHYDPRHEKPTTTTLLIKKTINLAAWREYVKSWSAYHLWMADNGGERDVADEYINELKKRVGWDENTAIDIVFPTIYYFARKR